jgi:hypothetical protein
MFKHCIRILCCTALVSSLAGVAASADPVKPNATPSVKRPAARQSVPGLHGAPRGPLTHPHTMSPGIKLTKVFVARLLASTLESMTPQKVTLCRPSVINLGAERKPTKADGEAYKLHATVVPVDFRWYEMTYESTQRETTEKSGHFICWQDIHQEWQAMPVGPVTTGTRVTYGHPPLP